MTYRVKAIFHSLQGEGYHAGRSAVFCRFAGCNLWSGREADRGQATCSWCDTDFVGGTEYDSAEELVAAVQGTWERVVGHRRDCFVVCTGGEPALQLDTALVEQLRATGCSVAVETNGTSPLPAGLDWVCVSPKAGTELIVRQGDELKLVHPQAGVDPRAYEDLAFDHFFLQPCDGDKVFEHTRLAVEYCRSHPRWRLSLQLHKLLGIE